MKTTNKVQKPLPDVPDDYLFSRAEVLEIFGLHYSLSTFPKATVFKKEGVPVRRHGYWHKAVIVAEHRARTSASAITVSVGKFPEWAAAAAADAMFSAAELVNIFGYASLSSFNKSVGINFPKPDFERNVRRGHCRTIYFWKKKTVIAEYRRRKEIEAGRGQTEPIGGQTEPIGGQTETVGEQT